MYKYSFAYSEPGYGTVEIEGPEMSEEDVLDEIERMHPTYVDVEILGSEEYED